MNIIKAVLTCLVGISFCFANISGIITDTGITPIAGAVVQIEDSKQMTTTLNDGSFTFATTNVASGYNKLPPNGFSVKINDNVMILIVPEQSNVEIAVFDLSGKLNSIVRQSIEKGIKNVVFPKCGAGIWLYKIKMANNYFTLKNTSISSVKIRTLSSCEYLSPRQFFSSQHAIATVNSVIIKVTKSGYLDSRIAITNTDTTGIRIRMSKQNDGTVADIDGNLYHIVSIGSQIWMQENWRSTKYNNGKPIPVIADSAVWNNRSLPGYCYFNNTTNNDSIQKIGALYNWYTLNTSLFAPAGWHIPTTVEWHQLEDYLITHGYNWDMSFSGNKIAKSLAAKTGWNESTNKGSIGNDLTQNNNSKFSAFPAGYRNFDGSFTGINVNSYWWSGERETYEAYYFSLAFSLESSRDSYSYKSCGYSVRLIKD